MNRIIGILFTIATLAIIVFAILNYGNYRSLCFTEPTEVEMPDIMVPDSLYDENLPIVEVTDSLATEEIIVDAPAEEIPAEEIL